MKHDKNMLPWTLVVTVQPRKHSRKNAFKVYQSWDIVYLATSSSEKQLSKEQCALYLLTN